MSPSFLTAAAVPWLVVAWIVTVIVTAALIYLIMRAVLNKTEPQKLPEVLRALTPMLRGIAPALTRPATSHLSEVGLPQDRQIAQNGDSPIAPAEEPS